ncbi:hypothetical protein C3497_12930 [Zoogloeaceae bacteirum Par-f-2]|nr:hypothetical protein C3497_12930 [Zoogloeaceae bacteirum Par-f-2]
MRNLLIFLLVLILIWWVRRALQRPGAGRARQATASERRRAPERMLACAHCGVHAPESEGVWAGEQFYCCEAHRKLGAQSD